MIHMPQAPKQPHEIYAERLDKAGTKLREAKTAKDVKTVLEDFANENLYPYIAGDLDEDHENAKVAPVSIKLEVKGDENTSAVSDATLEIPFKLTVSRQDQQTRTIDQIVYEHKGKKVSSTYSEGQHLARFIEEIAEHLPATYE